MASMGDSDTKQFSITLPLDAVEMIENGLIPFGLYGKKLATVFGGPRSLDRNWADLRESPAG